MKILVIGDIHFSSMFSINVFNSRGQNGLSMGLTRLINSIDFVINWLQSRNDIDIVVQLGDVYNSMVDVDRQVMYYASDSINRLYSVAKQKDIPLYILGGNHDLVSKGKYLTDSLPCTHSINKPEIIQDMLFVPYLDDFKLFQSLINESKEDVIFTHAPIKNTVVGKHKLLDKGIDINNSTSTILTGHIHIPSVNDNIYIVGSLCQLNFNEIGDINNGIMIYDTVSKESHRVENKVSERLVTVYSIRELNKYKVNGNLVRLVTNDKDLIAIAEKKGYNFEVMPLKHEKKKGVEITNLYSDVESPNTLIMEYLNDKYPYLTEVAKKYIN